MSFNLLGQAITLRPKVFVSYHHKGDQAYYDAFSKTFHDQYESVRDNSLDREIDSDNVDYVMQKIRDEYITGTSCTIVLVGANTWGRKYVDWEIKGTLDKQHALIGIQLPTLLPVNGSVSVPDRLHENIVSGYALWLTWSHLVMYPTHLPGYIQQAKGKGKNTISNASPRRLRNAS